MSPTNPPSPTSHRVHNFNAGPGALPLPVLERARAELLDFAGAGMSIMEMSHRGALYEGVHDRCIADIRALLGIDDSYSVLFMGGGARAQFAILAMNLLGAGRRGGYAVTGTWAEGALEEAKKIGDAVELWSSSKSRHDRVPQPGQLEIPSDLAYFHYTSNNTIYGTQYQHVPESGAVPLVCDMSSDIMSRPVDARRFAVIYAGAQKNMGPAGVTVALVRKDMLEHGHDRIPEVMHWKKVAAQNSLLNTPPVFAIYLVGLVMQHLRDGGGLLAVGQVNAEKAELLYRAIDASGGFYRGHAQPESRSQMNVTWRLPNEDLEKNFVKEAEASELVGLKGHRSVGGIRASLYNAVSLGSVRVLVDFMGEFKRKNG
jgi:phosphoserine aminotransferase